VHSDQTAFAIGLHASAREERTPRLN
jgi:hypothetical protein